ncbi:MAG TPA: SDR family oxidoreductase [Chloroflexota bacterium]|jgi:NAD(P)-dependent dehydrogenase (short-subunit alcohol dehydrogenase family)|nr:SDR family oxidoreductase [Chloroflexota bacterium]
MAGRFEGKVVLVTGGAAGIGHGIATAFAQEGAKIAIAEINAEAGDKAARDFAEQGVTARSYQCDVASYEDVQRAIGGAIADLGGLHVLVNNAGVSFVGPHTQDTAVEVWERSVAVMQSGVFYCSQVAGRHFLEQKEGNVINISSIRGFSSNPGRIAYCATKAAVIMMTRVMAAEWAPFGVRVNAIAPGITRTPMWDDDVARGAIDEPKLVSLVPMLRMCTPAEIGKVATFLASEDAAYITGTTVTIDGGATLIPRV